MKAWDEVLDIAYGRPREELAVRAAQCYEHTRYVFRQYDSVVDAMKRMDWLERSFAWEYIVLYLEDTGAERLEEEPLRAWGADPWWKKVLYRYSGYDLGHAIVVAYQILFRPGKMKLAFRQLELEAAA